MKNILITGIGGDIGQSILKCLKEIPYGHRLIGCDSEPFAGGRVLVEKFYEVPLVKKADAYAAALNKIIKSERIDYIFPAVEVEINFINENRKLFPKNVFFFINKSAIVKTFFDKYDTAQFLKEHGLAHPKTYLLSEHRGELKFPFLLKPRQGCGGEGIAVVHSQKDVEFFPGKKSQTIAQEIVGDKNEYTISVFSNGKKSYHVAFKRSLGYGNLSKVAEFINDPSTGPLAEKIAKAAGLVGSLNIQCKKSGRTYIPFEINPRLSSTVYTRHCFGFQDVKWWIDLKEGRRIQYAPKFKRGVAVRLISETFFDLVPAK